MSLRLYSVEGTGMIISAVKPELRRNHYNVLDGRRDQANKLDLSYGRGRSTTDAVILY